MTAREPALARAAVGVAKTFDVPFMGLAGTCHQAAAEELGVPFIAGTPSDFHRTQEVAITDLRRAQSGSPTSNIAQRVNSLSRSEFPTRHSRTQQVTDLAPAGSTTPSLCLPSPIG